jgi:hypothetical protein
MKPIEEKEKQLKQYFEISSAMLDALHQGLEEQVPALLEKRETCISKIDELDRSAGGLLLNERIEEQLKKLAALEEEILLKMQQSLKKLSNRIRFAKNERQYEEVSTVSKGVFYDRKK